MLSTRSLFCSLLLVSLLFVGACSSSGTSNDSSADSGLCSGVPCSTIDTDTDPFHCGRLHHACHTGQFCRYGTCVVSCAADETICEAKGRKTCANLKTSNLHCGSCGKACYRNQTCLSEQCTCKSGYYDCDGNPQNGCESSTECACKPTETVPCYPPGSPLDRGLCKGAVQLCNSTGFFGSCSYSPIESRRTCNDKGEPLTDAEGRDMTKLDANCDGKPDGCCMFEQPKKVRTCTDDQKPIINEGVDLTKLDHDCDGKPDGCCLFDKPERIVTCTSKGEPIVKEGIDLTKQDHDCDGHADGCVTACDLKVAPDSYVGCEYWGTFLHNHHPTNVAVILGNANSEPAEVQIYTSNSSKETPPKPYKTVVLEPNSVLPVTIFDCKVDNCKNVMLFGNGITDQASYRVLSSLPITAYQFNPMGKADEHTNDATLLLPRNVLGKRYLNMTSDFFKGHEDDGRTPKDYRPTFTITAVEPGITTVKVKLASNSGSDSDKKSDSMKSALIFMVEDFERKFSLKQYESLNLETSGASIGSSVVSDKRIAAFGGHQCTFLPLVYGACDHLEHQLLPVSTWGSVYHAVPSVPRWVDKTKKETITDMWRILALNDHTYVELSAPFNTGKVLKAGEFWEIRSRRSFEIRAFVADSANKKTSKLAPISVAGFIEGQGSKVSTIAPISFPDVEKEREPVVSSTLASSRLASYPIDNTGDPAMTVVVPFEQYRDSYSFVVPPTYESNFITLIIHKTGKISLDGIEIPGNEYQIFGSGNYMYTYQKVNEGSHSLQGNQPFGAYGYGFLGFTSYYYSLGLNLKEIRFTDSSDIPPIG